MNFLEEFQYMAGAEYGGDLHREGGCGAGRRGYLS